VFYRGAETHHSFAVPHKNEQNASEMLKLKSFEIKNQMHLLAKVDISKYFISAIADTMMHYKRKLGKRIKSFTGPNGRAV
jgi:hypothetical protein